MPGDAEADFSQQQWTAQTVFFVFTLHNNMDKDNANHYCCKTTSQNNCIVPRAFKWHYPPLLKTLWPLRFNATQSSWKYEHKLSLSTVLERKKVIVSCFNSCYPRLCPRFVNRAFDMVLFRYYYEYDFSSLIALHPPSTAENAATFRRQKWSSLRIKFSLAISMQLELAITA